MFLPFDERFPFLASRVIFEVFSCCFMFSLQLLETGL